MMQFTDALVKTYEKYAQERASYSPDAFKVQERSEFLKFLKNEGRETLLEIGCGHGQDALFFQTQGLRVLAVDNTPTMVKLTTEKGIRAQVLDCYDLGEIDETFDAIYTMNCLLHIPKQDFDRVLGLISGRLNENGLMYLGLWGDENFEGVWEKDRYEPKRFFSFWKIEALLEVLQRSFRLEYYRRLEPHEGRVFNSLIIRKR
ncbi:MAG: class I SAM-dependent methyltransferase [Candidatus Poribacteria bacterium]|nr:class I SAM-dependent methyltransferase [Candidatus Poribacteria bacterium]MDE0424541.1 class I SAM-dependent methyltransferase [Candidatus Poribacteria bacterium]